MCIHLFNRKKIYPITTYPMKCGTNLISTHIIKDKDEYELISYKQTDEPACEIIISEKITRI